MMDTQLIAFAGVSLLLAVTPGPDMAVVTRNALVHGRRGVFLTTSGIALALVLWVAATAIGLSALLRGSSEILFALKVVGACYLAYLGARTLIDSRRRPAEHPPRLRRTRFSDRDFFPRSATRSSASFSSPSYRSLYCQARTCCRA